MINCTGKGANSCGGAVRVGNVVEFWSKAAKRMRNFARQVSNWEAAALWEGLCFVGVMSLVAESDVKTDWLSGIKATTTDDAMGLFVFRDCKAIGAVMIVLMAVHSSSLSSMRSGVGMVA